MFASIMMYCRKQKVSSCLHLKCLLAYYLYIGIILKISLEIARRLCNSVSIFMQAICRFFSCVCVLIVVSCGAGATRTVFISTGSLNTKVFKSVNLIIFELEGRGFPRRSMWRVLWLREPEHSRKSPEMAARSLEISRKPFGLQA